MHGQVGPRRFGARVFTAFCRGRAEVCSAGVDPKGVNPAAILAMPKDGIDISHRRSKHADDDTSIAFDYVIHCL